MHPVIDAKDDNLEALLYGDSLSTDIPPQEKPFMSAKEPLPYVCRGKACYNPTRYPKP